MKKPWSLLSIFVFLSVFAIGILIGKTVQVWPYLTLKFEVDIVAVASSLFSVIVTLWVAAWVVSELDKKMQDGRSEKDLFIKRLESLYDRLNDFHNRTASPISLTEVTSTIKGITTTTNSMLKHLNSANIKPKQSFINEFLTKIGSVRHLLTNTPVNQANNIDLEIEIVAGIIHINEIRKAEIDQNMGELKEMIFQLQLEINKK